MKKRVFSIVILALSVFSAGGCTSSETWMVRGNTHLEARRFEDAFGAYNKAAGKLEKRLADHKTWNNAEKIVEVGLKAGEARRMAAHSLRQLDLTDDALGQFEKGYQDAPNLKALCDDYASLLTSMGGQNLRRGDLKSAEEHLTRAVKLNASNAEAARLLSDVRGRLQARGPAQAAKAAAESARSTAQQFHQWCGEEFNMAETRFAEALRLLDQYEFLKAKQAFGEAQGLFDNVSQVGSQRKQTQARLEADLRRAQELIGKYGKKKSQEALQGLADAIELLKPHASSSKEASRLLAKAETLRKTLEEKLAGGQRRETVAKAETNLREYALEQDTAAANRLLEEALELLRPYDGFPEADRILKRANRLKLLNIGTPEGRAMAEVPALNRLQLASLLVAELSLASASAHAVENETPVADLKLRARSLTDLGKLDVQQASAVRKVVELGLMDAASRTEFGYAGLTTRGEMARALAGYYRRVLGKESPGIEALMTPGSPGAGSGQADHMSGAEAITILNRLKAKTIGR